MPAAAACIALALPALAQDNKPRPAGTAPVDVLPTLPPASLTTEPQTKPIVTTRDGDAGEKVEEYRMGGKLYMMRVTPKHGHPYVLVDSKGAGTFAPQENTLDSGN